MKRILAAVLILAALFGFTSCNPDEPAAPEITEIDLNGYTIIRGEKASSTYAKLITEFKSELEKITGIELEYHDDLIIPDSDNYSVNEKEIVIGNTNRPESAEIITGLEANRYAIRAYDEKIVINATSYDALAEALSAFKSTLTAGSPRLSAPLDLSGKTEAKTYYDSLEKITMNIIGDSYFAATSVDNGLVWPKLLANKYSMTFHNNGIGGSTMSNYVDTNNPMVDRLNAMPNNKADIILLQGGKNDFNKNIPIGALTDDTTKTYMGAVRYLITELRKMYPDALIICVTVWDAPGTNTLGKTVPEYGKAMSAVCRDMEIPCFEAFYPTNVPVYMKDAAFRSKYCLTETDISHLNSEGMEKVLPYFERYIGRQYDKFLAAKK